MKDTIIVGKITGAHGIKGEIRIYPLTDDIRRFYDLEYFLCDGKRYTVSAVREHKGQILLQSADLPDRNAAETLNGKMIAVQRDDAVALEEGEYFIEDLKGLKVYDTKSDDVGILKDVLQAGAADVLVIEMEKKEILIAYLKRYVEEINIEEGFMRIDLTDAVR